jgi:hypothetical protein
MSSILFRAHSFSICIIFGYYLLNTFRYLLKIHLKKQNKIIQLLGFRLKYLRIKPFLIKKNEIKIQSKQLNYIT